MSNLKISQLPSGTVSSSVIMPAYDPTQAVGAQNVSISVAQLVQSAGTRLSLSGTPESVLALNPSSFSISGGVLTATATGITLSGTPITSFSPSSFTQSGGVVSANATTITLSGTPITSFSPSSFTQSGGVLSANSGGSSLTLNGTTITGLDTNSFSQTGGILAVTQTAFSSLASGTLASSSQILIVNSGTAYQVTMAQLAAELSTLTAPAITITAVGNQVTTNSFSVGGTLANYYAPPNLFYEDNAGSFSALPNATITSNSFSFTHPGLSTGTYTLTIKDGNNVSVTSNSFNVALAVATNATLSNVPTTDVSGSPITGVIATLTPSNATAYAVLMTGGADQAGGRTAFTGTSVPSLTPTSAGTYVIAIYATPSGGSPLVTSSNINVTATAATAATIGTVSSTGTRGVAITGIADTLTPSNASAYAVLALAGVDEGSRVAFAGTTLPSLTPQSTGNYTIKIYAASTGGSALATSSAITVTAAVATAATVSGAPSTATQGAAITGVTDTLTPTYANAYAVLYTNNADEGSRQLFSGTNVPSLTPQTSGVYTIKLYAALTGGSALATSSPITVSYATATAATIAGAPSTGTLGTPITGLTDTLTPSYAQAYACLNNGSDVLPRTAFTGTSVPSLTPASSGSFTVKIYAASTGGAALATSSTITVSAVTATAATISGAPSTGSQGAAIAGITDTLTPSNAQAYAVLYTGGADEGSRVAFTGTTYPSLIPASTGSYTAKIYAAATGGSALATSSVIAITAPVGVTIGSGVSPTLVLDASSVNSVTSDAGYTTPQTTNNGTVLGWKDFSSNANNFNQTTTGNGGVLITNSQNSKSGIQFSGVGNNFLNGPTSLATAMAGLYSGAGFTMAVVMKVSDITLFENTVNFYTGGGANFGLVWQYGAPFIYQYDGQGNRSYANPTSGFANNQLLKFVLVVDKTNNLLRICLNTASDVTNNQLSPPGTYNAISVGAAGLNGNPPVTTIYEVDFWPVTASGAGGSSPTGDIANIMTYLTNKWGS